MGCAGNGYQYGNDDFLKRGSGLFEDDGYGKCCYGDGGDHGKFELAGTVEFRFQEDDSFFLVPGSHDHLLVAG